MWNLTICFGPTGTVWAFLFKEKESAQSIFDIMTAPCPDDRTRDHVSLTFQDDFGQHAHFMLGDVVGVLLEDLEAIEQARIERAIADEHVKAKFLARAKTDPVIRQAMQGQQSPIMSPMGMR